MMSQHTTKSLSTQNHRLHFLIVLIFSALVLTILPINPAYSAKLSPFTVDYDFSVNGVTVAHMTRSLRPKTGNEKNERYIFESSSRASGLFSWFFKGNILERSTWAYSNNNIRPLHYLYHRSGKKKRHVELNFDWQRNIVTNNINNDPWKMTVSDNTLDKLLYQLKMMFDLQLEPKVLDYSIADGGKLKNYHFEILGEETIKIPLGSIKTIKLRKRNNKRTTTVWSAINYSFLPVRIEHIDKNGRKLKSEVVKVNGLPFQTQP